MPNEELKPCPFCGGEAVIWTMDEFDDGDFYYRAECRNCQAGFGVNHETKEEAIESWNRRADDGRE